MYDCTFYVNVHKTTYISYTRTSKSVIEWIAYRLNTRLILSTPWREMDEETCWVDDEDEGKSFCQASDWSSHLNELLLNSGVSTAKRIDMYSCAQRHLIAVIDSWLSLLPTKITWYNYCMRRQPKTTKNFKLTVSLYLGYIGICLTVCIHHLVQTYRAGKRFWPC